MGLEHLGNVFPRLAIDPGGGGPEGSTINTFARAPEFIAHDARDMAGQVQQQRLPLGDERPDPIAIGRRLLRVELEGLKTNPPLLMQHIASRLIEYGRAVGGVAQSRIDRDQTRMRISQILDRATAALPHVEQNEQGLEAWRDNRRLLFSALQEWHDEGGVRGNVPAPPHPTTADALLKAAVGLVAAPKLGRFARARRAVAAYGDAFADLLEAVSEVMERKRQKLESEYNDSLLDGRR